MSPEQATGDRQLDARSDVYSLGAVLYEMLAGEPPVTGPNAQAMIAKLMTERPIRLRVVRDTVPEGIDTAVAKALSKLPADRFSSAAAFSQALSRPAVDSTTVIESRAEASRLRRVSWWTGRRAALVGVVVLLIAAALAVRRYGASRTSAPRSLAVLPFETVGNDTANAYFAEGIAEEVTNALAQVPGLRIAGRRSAIRFSGKGASAEQIGAALDVGAVLEGTVRRAGDQIRVSAQLTSASDGLVLWSQSYPRELKDVFAVQEEIARAIAGALQVAFASGDGADRAARGTTDLEAYDLYLKGLYFYRRRGTGTAITQSLASLEQAVARDSSFARAQAALATALLVLPYYSLTHMGEVLPPARAAARRAARLDPALADAHTALGIAHEEAFEWDEAEAEYRRAIALDPNAAEARYRLGRTFVMQRRIPEAIAGLRLAKAHDPLYFFTATYLGWALTQAGEHDAGIAELRRGLELEPNALPPLTFLTFSYYSANRPDSAAVFARRLAVASSIPVRLGGSAFVLARIGHREEAEALVRRLEALPAGTWTRSSSLAFGYLGLGDTTRALAAMERAAATDGDLLITYLGVLAGDLWSSPRFAAVLRRFNLDPARMGGHAVAPASSRP
jgi:serine/threonine-protein kinase